MAMVLHHSGTGSPPLPPPPPPPRQARQVLQQIPPWMQTQCAPCSCPSRSRSPLRRRPPLRPHNLPGSASSRRPLGEARDEPVVPVILPSLKAKRMPRARGPTPPCYAPPGCESAGFDVAGDHGGAVSAQAVWPHPLRSMKVWWSWGQQHVSSKVRAL